MSFFKQIQKLIMKPFKSKPKTSSPISSSGSTSNWVFNPDASFLPPENTPDSYENYNSFGTFDPNPHNDSLDYANKFEKSETANRMDDSLSEIASRNDALSGSSFDSGFSMASQGTHTDDSLPEISYESLSQANKRLQEEVKKTTEENNRLHEQLKKKNEENNHLHEQLKKRSVEVNNLNTSAPLAPPPPPPPDIYKTRDIQSAVKEQIAKNKGLDKPRKESKPVLPEATKVTYMDELTRSLNKRGKTE